MHDIKLQKVFHWPIKIIKIIKQNVNIFLSHCVFCTRPFSFFLSRNWYAKRWGMDGVDYQGKLYLIDIGAITIGWRDSYEAEQVRKAKL